MSQKDGIGINADGHIRHTLAEDVFGILCGTFVVSLGVFLLQASGTVTGGTAGLSLLLSYVSGVPFGVVFAAVNLPFFGLALWQKGWNFTIRSLISVVLVSAMSLVHNAAVPELQINPAYGTIAGNLLAGIGILILVRHKSSVGGFSIVAVIAQEKFGVRAGFVQMVMDLIVVLSSLAVLDLSRLLISIVGAIVLNSVLVLNHRPGRYTGY